MQTARHLVSDFQHLSAVLFSAEARVIKRMHAASHACSYLDNASSCLSSDIMVEPPGVLSTKTSLNFKKSVDAVQ